MPLSQGQIPSANQLRTLRATLAYYDWLLRLLLELARKYHAEVTL